MLKLLPQYITLLILFVLSSACNQNPIIKQNLSEVENDSIVLWINQSKNESINTEVRKEYLIKAYELNGIQKNDSLRNRYLVKMAFQGYKLEDSLFFRKVNSEAIKLSKELRDTVNIAKSNSYYGFFYSRLERIDSAYFYFDLAQKNFQVINKEYDAARMLYNMAIIQKDVKDYTGSEISAFQAIAKFKKLDKHLNLYYCNNLLGVVFNGLQEYEKAILYHKKALNNLKHVKNKRNFKELSLNNLGLVYQNKKDYKSAIEQFSNALKSDNLKKKDIYNYTRLIDNLTYTKFLSGDTINLLQGYNKALNIRDSINYVSGVIISKLHLAEYYAYTTDTIKAISYAKEANVLATLVNNNRDILASLQLLSKLDNVNADVYLKDYIVLSDILQLQERKLRNKFTRIRFETDEYIEETEKLSQQKIVIAVISAIAILILILLYYIRNQRAKNKELLFEKEQQKFNEEIYALLLKQQSNIEEGRLKERHRIAEELHDGVLGKIFGTRLSFGFLNLKGDKETLAKQDVLISELQEVEKEIRDISHELKNELLSSKQNFNTLVEEFVKKQSSFSGYKYAITSDKAINWNIIDGDVKINCYRIIQEALQNCNKHANATFINIDFSVEKKILKLYIKDNGLGFDKKKKKKGIGLKNIQSRSHKMRAKFEINTSSKGTVLTFLIPL